MIMMVGMACGHDGGCDCGHDSGCGCVIMIVGVAVWSR